MEIIQATNHHISTIHSAFETLRNNRSNGYVDYLALPEIADFHRDRIINSVQSTGQIKLFMENNQLIALAGTQFSDWHSEHFGVPYYKVQPFYLFDNTPQSVKSVVEHLKSSICIQPQALYTMRIEAREAVLPYILSQHKFIDVGSSVRLVYHPEIDKNVDNFIVQSYDNTIFIRDYRTSDLPEMQMIGKHSHTYSHFHREIRFPKERTSELFARWIEKCINGFANKVIIAEADGKVIGFSILLMTKSLIKYIGKQIGVVDFIVVDQTRQGKGIGKVLLGASIDWLKEQVDIIELRTMADNLQAIRFYEKNGFRMLSADHHYHYWTETRHP